MPPCFISFFMSYKDHSKLFRKQIRRNQLDEMFANKRKLLLQNEQLENMQDQLVPIDFSAISNQHYLKCLAKMSRTQNGMQILHKSQIEISLYQFFKPQYLNSELQYYSTFVVSNLYYLSVPLQQSLLQTVTGLLKQNINVRILVNLCNLVENIISQQQNVRQVLLRDYDFVNTIIRLWNYSPHASQLKHCSSLVSLMFKLVLNNNQLHQQFEKLKPYLIRVLRIDYKPQLDAMLKMACMAFFQIFQMFPKQTNTVVQGNIIQRFIQLSSHFRSKRFAMIILHLLELIFSISCQNFNKISSQNNFEISQKNEFLSARDLKFKTYDIIYQSLQKQKISVKDIVNKNYYKYMMKEYETSTDTEILCSLTYIFVHIFLNTDDSGLKLQIQYNLDRTRDQNIHNYQIVNHIHYASEYFSTKKH